MLTQSDIAILCKPFETSDHEFNRTYTYVREGAITSRIEQIDPSWSWQVLSVAQRDQQCVVHGRLTISGVNRDGVGQATIEKGSNGRDANEAEKSATTDAMKRAARLFGVGRYLLDSDEFVGDKAAKYAALEKWLAGVVASAYMSRAEFINGCNSLGIEVAKIPDALKARNLHTIQGDDKYERMLNGLKMPLPQETPVSPFRQRFQAADENLAIAALNAALEATT